MDWQTIGLSVVNHIKLFAAGIGVTGGGVCLIKFLKHCPAPYQDQPWMAAMFDTAQDLVSNARIGERRTRGGIVVAPVAAAPEVPQPVAAPKAEASTAGIDRP